MLVLALLAGAPATARATVMVPLDLDALIDAAEQVVLARVESQEARWNRSQSAIYTEATLRVTRTLKGVARAGEVVKVRREGGVVGKIGMRVSGAAGFVVGEEVLVFLERRGPRSEALWTVGMAQGKMAIATVDGQKVAIRSAGGIAYNRAPSTVEPAIRPLDEVVARVAARSGGH